MIKLLITGGTIDKTYNPLSGKLVFVQSHLQQMLTQSRMTLNVETEVLFLKDSLDISDKDRDIIVSKCIDCNAENIVIAHGTDTMAKTAKLLDLHIKNKTIVLFGAMLPYSVKNSDAMFNLSTAFSAVQINKAGVYIAMNGKVFKANKVKKNKDLAIFEAY